jgi:hypothetical protein
MFKIDYINVSNKKATETIKTQKSLAAFIATLDELGCEIINIYKIGAKGVKIPF